VQLAEKRDRGQLDDLRDADSEPDYQPRKAGVFGRATISEVTKPPRPGALLVR
jgi:hypothetical protein